MHIEEAMLTLLMEAGQDSNTICLVKADGVDYVKGHSVPEEARSVFVDALNGLFNRNSVKLLADNRALKVFALTERAWQLLSLAKAKEILLDELRENGFVCKVHSADGEFIQCGPKAYDAVDEERIVFLKAMADLLHGGIVKVADENRFLCRFEPTSLVKRIETEAAAAAASIVILPASTSTSTSTCASAPASTSSSAPASSETQIDLKEAS